MSHAFTRPHLTRDGVEIVAELAVLRALETAGKRARLPRACLPQRQAVPSHTVHVRFDLGADLDRLLLGVWDHLQLVVPDGAEALARACDEYVRDLIIRRAPHELGGLHEWLSVRLGG